MSTKLTAETAKQQTLQNAMPLDKLLEDISATSKNGQFAWFAGTRFVSQETRDELMRLGFKLTYGKDMLGLEVLIITWA